MATIGDFVKDYKGEYEDAGKLTRSVLKEMFETGVINFDEAQYLMMLFMCKGLHIESIKSQNNTNMEGYALKAVLSEVAAKEITFRDNAKL